MKKAALPPILHHRHQPLPPPKLWGPWRTWLYHRLYRRVRWGLPLLAFIGCVYYLGQPHTVRVRRLWHRVRNSREYALPAERRASVCTFVAHEPLLQAPTKLMLPWDHLSPPLAELHRWQLTLPTRRTCTPPSLSWGAELLFTHPSTEDAPRVTVIPTGDASVPLPGGLFP